MCVFHVCAGAVYSQYPSKKKSRRPIKHPFIPDKEENVTTREVTVRLCLLLVTSFTQVSMSFSLFRVNPLKGILHCFAFLFSMVFF